MTELSMKRICLVVVLTGLFSACGFHPRGVATLPDGARALYLEAPTVLHDELSVYLADGGAVFVASADVADVVLKIIGENFDHRTLSVDPDTGKEREFELTYAVTFLARKLDGSLLLKRQKVTLLRDYVFDADQVLGKSREQNTLRAEMRRDAAQQILTRLNSALQG